MKLSTDSNFVVLHRSHLKNAGQAVCNRASSVGRRSIGG